MADIRKRILIGCSVVIVLLIAAPVAFLGFCKYKTQSYWASPEGIKENRRLSLPEWASSAVNSGNLDLARSYAKEMLKTGDSDDSHHAHTVLGRIALREGDMKVARAQLLASAHVSGTPVLESFGPNMMLARELLNRGESKTVLEYFKLCGNFWASPDKKPHEELGNWTREVQAGKMPDFGTNLNY